MYETCKRSHIFKYLLTTAVSLETIHVLYNHSANGEIQLIELFLLQHHKIITPEMFKKQNSRRNDNFMNKQ